MVQNEIIDIRNFLIYAEKLSNFNQKPRKVFQETVEWRIQAELLRKEIRIILRNPTID